MPEGPLGTPRPLATSSLVIEAHGPFSAGASLERALQNENEIRTLFDIRVDVVEENGVMKYIIREDRLSIKTWNNLLNAVRSQTKSVDLYVSAE